MPDDHGFPWLLAPLEVGPVRLANRMVLGPHGTGMAVGGSFDEAAMAYIEARVAHGVGLVVGEAHHVVPIAGQTYPNGDASTDACIEPLRRMADLCRSHGSRYVGQLYHEGRARMNSVDGSRELAVAPSALPDERFHIVPRAMTTDDVRAMVANFGTAAGRMAAAGVDGVEVLVGMGYLHAQFLSPRTNLRTDDYGGSPEARQRFLAETLAAIRDAVGPDRMVGFRIVPEDHDPDGLRLEDSVPACVAMAEAGLCDYVSVALGGTHTLSGTVEIVPSMFVGAAAVRPTARAVRSALADCARPVPVLAGGRINQPQDAERTLADGDADAVVMVRAFIADPAFAGKVRDGRADDVRACIACNQACIGHRPSGHAVSCIQHPETGRELAYGSLAPADPSRRIAVVGGGPAGMKAAAVAAARGHDVVLHERARRLGGQALLAERLPGRAEFGGIVDNLAREVAAAGVDVRLGSDATVDDLATDGVDAVVVATGASPTLPDPSWTEGARVCTAADVLDGTAEVRAGERVVVADWRCDWIGPGVAEVLRTDHRCHVRLCVNGEALGQSLQSYVRHQLAGRLHAAGVEVSTYLRLVGADADTAYLQHVITGEPVVLDDVDLLVVSGAPRSRTDLLDGLAAASIEVHGVGDCLSPRTAEEAVLDGLKVGAVL